MGEKLHKGAGWLLNIVIVVYLLLFLAMVVGGTQVDFEVLGVHVHAKDAGKPVLTALLAGFLRLLLAVELPNALLMVFSVGLALGSGEVALRVLDHPLARLGSLPSFNQASEHMGYEHVPGLEGTAALGYTIRINSHGLRDRERAREKPPGAVRILGLGDSFTFGMGVPLEATYLKRLEEKLGNRGREVDVLNGGVVGYNLYRALGYLKEKGLRYSPDLVIFGYFWDDPAWPNDPIQMAADFEHRKKLHAARPEPKGGSYLKRFLTNTYNFLWKGKYRAFSGRSWVRTVDARVEGIKSSEFAVAALEGTYDLTPFREVVADLKSVLDREGIGLLVLGIPDAVQLMRPAWQHSMTAMAGICADLDIRFLDATPRFEAHPDPGSLYLFPFDAHTSPAGHEIMAEMLAEEILDGDLLPKR